MLKTYEVNKRKQKKGIPDASCQSRYKLPLKIT